MKVCFDCQNSCHFNGECSDSDQTVAFHLSPRVCIEIDSGLSALENVWDGSDNTSMAQQRRFASMHACKCFICT
jgi:hypothetical protein